MNLNFAVTEDELPQLKMFPEENELDYLERDEKCREKACMCHKGARLYTDRDGAERAFGQPCGQIRHCIDCYKHRVEDAYHKLRASMRLHHGTWQYKSFPHEEAKYVRRTLETYRSYPQEDGTTIIASSDFEDGTDIPLDFGSLITLLKKWIVTPKGMRMTSSRNCQQYKKQQEEKENKNSVKLDASIPEIEVAISVLDGSIVRDGPHEITYYGVAKDDVIDVLVWAKKTATRRVANSLIDNSPQYETICREPRPEVAAILKNYDKDTFFEQAKAVLAG